MGQRTPMDETLAFTALFELDPGGFGKLGMHEATAMRRQLQDDFYTSSATNLYEYTKGWLTAREIAAQAASGGCREDGCGRTQEPCQGRQEAETRALQQEPPASAVERDEPANARTLTPGQLSQAAQREARITTVSGRTGRLTGYHTRDGDPCVLFDDESEYAINPDRIVSVDPAPEEDDQAARECLAARYGGASTQDQQQRQA